MAPSHRLFTRADALSAADRVRDAFERELKTLVDIPTVSGHADRHADILRGVDAAAAVLRDAGAEVDILRPPTGSGSPIVHGRFVAGPSLPTVTVYNHMDVQPADREGEGWRTDPFVCEIEGDVYRGRGTTDDKGPALTAMHGAAYARACDVPINVNFLWEFEEEIGSPSFASIIEQHRGLLATGSVVVSDTVWVSRDRPAAPAGLRGLQGFLLRLRTAEHDTHSGVVGGAARNPLAELMWVVDQCFDARTGDVKIPGFYDGVLPPTEVELADFETCGFSIDGFKSDHHLHSLRTDDPREVMLRLWARPTFEVHGVIGGYAGEGIKTIVPPAGEVKLSCRLVPNMTTAGTIERVRAFVAKIHPEVEVVSLVGLEPFRGTTQGPLADAVRGAVHFGFGNTPVFVREGGAIGAVVSMEKILGVPVMFLGLSLPEHGYHAPNECYDWGQARGGMAAFADYIRRVAALDAR